MNKVDEKKVSIMPLFFHLDNNQQKKLIDLDLLEPLQ